MIDDKKLEEMAQAMTGTRSVDTLRDTVMFLIAELRTTQNRVHILGEVSTGVGRQYASRTAEVYTLREKLNLAREDASAAAVKLINAHNQLHCDCGAPRVIGACSKHCDNDD